MLAWTLASTFLLGPSGGRQWHEEVVSPYLLPGGLADPAGRTGFFGDATHGITAIELRNGKVLWQSKAAVRPIMVTGVRLYASAPAGPGQLCVVALDLLHKGEVIFRSDSVDVAPATEAFPEIVRWTLGQDQLCVSWETSGSVAGGATIDLANGRVQPQRDRSYFPLKAPQDFVKYQLRWQGFVGCVYKALVLEETAAGQRLLLRGWDITSGLEGQSREVFHGARLVIQPTLNDRYVCVRDAVPSPDHKSDERGRHAWRIFDAATGDFVGRLSYEPGTQSIAVIGPRAFVLVAGPIAGSLRQPFASPRTIKAIDLATGKTIWERPAEEKRLTPVGM
jgi:hypothetical protein